MPLRTKIDTGCLPRYLGTSEEDTALIDLATNENRLGPSALALRAYAEASADLFRYPDSTHAQLKAALSERYGVPGDGIACGAGSDELISLLTRLFAGPGDEVLFPDFSFIMFLRYALRVGATPVRARTIGYRLSVDAILESLTDKTSIVFVANPNNPTGSYLPKSEIRRLAANIPANIPLVLDSAYSEYAGDSDYSDGLDLMDEFKNVIVLRTFSKLYGLAGLRIGWCAAPTSLVDKLNRLRGPYNITGPAQAAASMALADRGHEDASREHNKLWRTRLTQEISQSGFQVEPSGGNFITVVFPNPAAAQGAHRHIAGMGMLTRPLHDYGMPECIRITVGRTEDNERIIEAFRGLAQLRNA